ncbi:MAG TPA: hemolysin III family protein [Stellaceae bacterium]|nr:hemolysin III family protein [Stellaceae bacterium]
MPSTNPVGTARRVNRLILTLTLAFSGVAMLALLVVAATSLDRSKAAAGLVYGATLLLCSLTSFLYNMIEETPRRGLLRYLDHAAIFLLIAGTYTPFAAQGVRGPFGISLLEWIWGLAVVGMVLKLLLDQSYDRFFVGIYLAIGWLFVSALDQFLHILTPISLTFLVIGGIAYTAGAFIYLRDIGHWTDPIWHCCVLTGSFTHYVAVLALLLAVQSGTATQRNLPSAGGGDGSVSCGSCAPPAAPSALTVRTAAPM